MLFFTLGTLGFTVAWYSLVVAAVGGGGVGNGGGDFVFFLLKECLLHLLILDN